MLLQKYCTSTTKILFFPFFVCYHFLYYIGTTHYYIPHPFSLFIRTSLMMSRRTGKGVLEKRREAALNADLRGVCKQNECNGNI